MSELQKVDLVSFHFTSHFLFYFILFSIYWLFWNLGLGFNMTSHHPRLSHYDTVIVTSSYHYRT